MRLVHIVEAAPSQESFGNIMPRNRPSENSIKYQLRKTDTDVYVQIRKRGNDSKQDLLEKLSSDHARKCVSMLLDKDNERIALAFDPLLEIEGLRHEFLLKVMHKVISSHCTEVHLQHY